MGRVKPPGILIAGVLAALLVAACGSTQTSAPKAAGLETRKVTAGAVEVTVDPETLDATGAVFKVALDTHSGDLTVDLAKTATLEVGGRAWSNATWKGDATGGHHRQGELRFTAQGPATGDVRLRIDGLPAPVLATWNLPANK